MLIQNMYKEWLTARDGTEGNDGQRHFKEMTRLEIAMADHMSRGLGDMITKLTVSKETDNHRLVDSVLYDLQQFDCRMAAE